MKLDFKKIGVLSLILAGMVSLISCLNNDDELPVPQDLSFVAFVNVSPDSNGLKFYSNGNLLNQTPATYLQIFGYLGIESGQQAITVGSENNVLDTLSVNFSKDKRYSVFAINRFDDLDLMLYEDVLFSPSQGKSAIRFIQLSPDAPRLIVSIEGEQAPIGTFEYRQSTLFFEISEGINKNLYLINAETQDTIFTKEFDFDNRKIFSIFSTGFVNTDDENEDLDVQFVPISL